MHSDKLKAIFTNRRVIIVLVVILLALFAINPQPWVSGVTIRNVGRNSSAAQAGIISPSPTAAPTSKERIVAINSLAVSNIDDYSKILASIPENRTIVVKTNKASYQVLVGQSHDIGLSVYNAPKTNLRLGLDLQGGTRVLLQPDTPLSGDQLDGLLANMKERLNVYGLSDIVVRSAADLSGNQFIVVEIAGANEDEVKDLLSHQGKFEARVGNESVFKGGNDITYVCRSAECSGIDSRQGCGQVQGGYSCRFMFSISLSPEAAKRQADITKSLTIITENDEPYLNETLDLYLDDQLVDTLHIGADLRGQAVTDIAISGGGVGTTQKAAIDNTLANMKKLQTVLITGSLPVKLNIVQTENISPALGQEFARNAFIMGALSILAVAAVILIRYRRWVITIPILIINWIEIFLLLAFAALIGWNLDVASIAGVLVSIGTGVDDQIVITDEALRGGTKDENYQWKQKLKRAMFIVFAAYFTTAGSMVPLLFAGAGLLKGFAITTIIGISIGVWITRPAYAHVIEILVKE